ncbi:DUF1707 SHOCT-like domain-containing protein [Micromonospora sp. WMMD558]|uniref:DUF1707 SHOCT-like domain-containing protein n=1 Tax=unclassified Micromonospora TaxID=2617518 RepID=UPI0012B4D120|nr:DUF1707 domain-containing protein [Micromonospora sp. WMMC415]
MRAADADRQAVADRLRAAVDEGRLDLHEYDERLQQAYTARTYGELDALLADLPAPAGAAASALAVPGGNALAPPGGVTGSAGMPAVGARPVVARWLVEVWEPWLKVVPIVVAVWAVTSLLAGDALYFWPGWVAGPWGAVLLVRTVLGITSGEPARWAAERERRRQRRREKRARKRERKAARRESRKLPGESG